MDSGFSAAVSLLPQDLKDMVATQEPPDSYSDLDEAWGQVFSLWLQHGAMEDTADLMTRVNSYLAFARPQFRLDEDGGLWERATADDVRQCYETYFAGLATTDGRLSAAIDAAGQCGGGDDDETQLMQDLSYAAIAAYNRGYADFVGDVAAYAVRPAAGDTVYADEIADRVRTENQRVIGTIEDRQQARLRIHNWGGTVLVLLGENHDVQGLGSAVFDGYIVKKRSATGPGEWLVEDPGDWLNWVEYEMAALGSKKKVVVGSVDKYEDWDQAGDGPARILAENRRVVESIPDRQYTTWYAYEPRTDVVYLLLGEKHDLTTAQWNALGDVLDSGYIAKRRARVGAGEWVVSQPKFYLTELTALMSDLGSKKDVVVGDPTKYDQWPG